MNELSVRQLTIRIRVENDFGQSVFSGFRPNLRFGSGALRSGESLVSSEVMDIVFPSDTEVLVPGMEGVIHIRFLPSFGQDQHPRICPGAPIALHAGSQVLATGTILNVSSYAPATNAPARHADSAEGAKEPAP